MSDEPHTPNLARKNTTPTAKQCCSAFFLGFLGEETELAAVVLGDADEVLAHLAVGTNLLAELGDDLRIRIGKGRGGGRGRDRSDEVFSTFFFCPLQNYWLRRRFYPLRDVVVSFSG